MNHTRSFTMNSMLKLWIKSLLFFAAFGGWADRSWAGADATVIIPWQNGATFTTNINLFATTVGETKKLHVAPQSGYRFNGSISYTGSDGLTIVQTHASSTKACYDLTLTSPSKHGTAQISGAIEPIPASGGGGGGSPPPVQLFMIDVLQRSAVMMFTEPTSPSLIAHTGSRNGLTVRVILGNETVPSAGTVTFSVSSGDLGGFTTATVPLTDGTAATSFIAADSGSGTITATASGLQDDAGNSIPDVAVTFPVQVFRMALVPDWNHDRVIDDTDRKPATSSNPFRFWINDSTESGDIITAGADIPGQANGNGTLNQVNGRADLVNYFPVWLDLKQALEILSPDDPSVQYKLRQSDSAIKIVYSDLTTNQVGQYLIADDQLYGSQCNQLASVADVVAVSADGIVLPPGFLNRIKTNSAKGILLVEGVKATQKPLVLEVWKGDQKLGERHLPLSITSIEQMYRWINLRASAGGTATIPTNVDPPKNYPDSLCSSGKQFVFVVGYNVNEQGARGWGSEIFKRLYHSGSQAMFTTVSWWGNDTQIPTPQGKITPNYYLNVTHAFQTANDLANVVTDKLPGQKCIAGHSLGNMMVSSAIVDHNLNVETYFLLNAAVAMEAYDLTIAQSSQMQHPDWQNYTNRLWATEWYRLFDANDARSKLTWRGRFGSLPRAVNFFADGEEVLINAEKVPTLLTRPWRAPWAAQEMLKGRTEWSALASAFLFSGIHRQGGWAFNTDAYTDHYIDNGSGLLVPVPWPPLRAAAITDANLRTNSFFRSFSNTQLYGPNGSAIAAEWFTRAQLLSEAIPALSYATGANDIDQYSSLKPIGRGGYMMDSLENGWPQQRIENIRQKNRWFHSDIRNVAYCFTYQVFDKKVKLGALK